MDHQAFMRFLEEWGGKERLHEVMIAFERRHDALEAIKGDLLQRYPNKWVACQDGHIIVSDTLDGLIQLLDEKGIPSQETPIVYLDPNPMPLVLIDAPGQI